MSEFKRMHTVDLLDLPEDEARMILGTKVFDYLKYAFHDYCRLGGFLVCNKIDYDANTVYMTWRMEE